MNGTARLSREGGNLLTLVYAIWSDSLHLNKCASCLVHWRVLKPFYKNSRAYYQGLSNSFTAKYNCNKLVYYETFGRIEDAIAREKQTQKNESIFEG